MPPDAPASRPRPRRSTRREGRRQAGGTRRPAPGSRWVPRRLPSSSITSAERPGVLVRARREQRVEDVADGADPRGQRDLVSLQPLRVAASVPALVVAARDLLGHLDQLGLRAGENARADRRVRLHLLPLGGIELPRLQQDLVGDADLADVVQRACVAQQVRLARRSCRPRGRAARRAGPCARCARRSRRRAIPPPRRAGGRSRARRRRGPRCARARAARAARCRGVTR